MPFNLLKTLRTSKSVTRIALGLSFSSYELMKRLFSRGHVDSMALTPESISHVGLPPEKNLVIKPFDNVIDQYWKNGSVFIFVGAIGAVIRLIKPFIKNKEEDPAVLVMDFKSQNIIPILGGHYGGADQLAKNISEDLGCNAVLTSFSSVKKSLLLDSFGHAWGWKRNAEASNWKKLMIAQAKGKKINFWQDSGNILWQSSKGFADVISDNRKEIDDNEQPSFVISSNSFGGCSWHPPVLWVGIGCEKNTSTNLLFEALQNCFDNSELAKESIAGFASIDLKKNEPAFLSLVEKESISMKFYTSSELAKITVPNPSNYVKESVGTSSVAEAAALLSAGEGAFLRVEKKVFHAKENQDGAVTIAIAESIQPFAPSRGELHLVGSGPGDFSLLTQDARFALSKSVIWIGYKRYLDLLEPLRREGQVRIDGKLTNEKERCKKALDLAIEGATVALISSGDSGIYGMAGLALDYWLKLLPVSRPTFNVHPGISSFQLVAAKVGAPLMHDFCTISLSDCLTPWETILGRLKAVASADFVIALYNPRSKERNWQLKKAIEILLEERSAGTPVVLARQIGRSEEKISFYELGNFPYDQVDMLSLVLIGNSMSFIQDGLFLTPRGY